MTSAKNTRLPRPALTSTTYSSSPDRTPPADIHEQRTVRFPTCKLSVPPKLDSDLRTRWLRHSTEN